MDKKRFSTQLYFIVPKVIELISSEYDISEEEATELFYSSELYSQLEDEKTKLWHLSHLSLFEMIIEENETGQITYPEEA